MNARIFGIRPPSGHTLAPLLLSPGVTAYRWSGGSEELAGDVVAALLPASVEPVQSQLQHLPACPSRPLPYRLLQRIRRLHLIQPLPQLLHLRRHPLPQLLPLLVLLCYHLADTLSERP